MGVSPVFPLIVGLAFLAAWVLSLFRAWGLLIPGAINGAVGVIGLAFTLAGLSHVYLGWIFQFWPVALILLGLLVLVGALVGSGARRERPQPAQPERPLSGVPEEGAHLEDYGSEQRAAQASASEEFKRKQG